ncbi:hypothetical protein KSP39_PZI018202 [Platanthera zijinensis]|uniref:BRCA1-associated protein n=1 Tax=Platanthera zijinensis TaxID=2320716 RepID=A0AAP0FYY3_9ASPA
MFCLRILSVDSPRLEECFTGSSSAQRPPPNSTGDEIYAATSSSRNPNANPRIEVLRGIIHLYCKTAPLSSSFSPSPFSSIFPHSLDPLLPADRGTLLFVPAVPNHLSPEDFLRFCGSYVEGSTEIQIIRNDAVEDRYSVLVQLKDQKSADAFYFNLNGWRFTSAEREVCHILFTSSAEITESIEFADTPPSGYTELPTCLVCIERLDQEMIDIISTTCDHSFQCSCISKWANSSCSVCQFCQEHSVKPICSMCETSKNLWICVICGFVGCGRDNEGHAFKHWKDTQHCFALDLETQRVWDYVGDKYVHRINTSNSDDVSSEMNSYCRSSGEQFESCSYGEDSGISEALPSSKVEAVKFHFKL